MHFCSFPILGSLFVALNLQQIVGKPIIPSEDQAILNIPTPQESAVLARRILRFTPIATFSTIFPSDSKSSPSLMYPRQKNININENRPKGLANTPIGLMDYVADCEASGDPTVLAIGIATTFKNVAAGSNVSISFKWTPPYGPSSFPSLRRKRNNKNYSPASLPRFSLFGYLERLSDTDVKRLSIKECFVETHPDAKLWLPGNEIHASEWQRFVVQQIYWVGGFGDRAYIGWIPVDNWKYVRQEEIDRVRLPGETRGWKEVIKTFFGHS